MNGPPRDLDGWADRDPDPLRDWAATVPDGPSTNEVEVDLQLRRVLLREFTFSLRPLRWGSELAGGRLVTPIRGVELIAVARDTGLTVSLRFERGEFVNLATAGLAGLDAADAATEQTEGGELDD